MYTYIYMPVKDLYYQKYLKYKNKYLNLQSQIGGAIIDDNYIMDIQFYMRYTEDIFHYLDKFFELNKKERTINKDTKDTLSFRIEVIIDKLLSYNKDLNYIKRGLEDSNTYIDIELTNFVELTSLKFNELDKVSPDKYDKHYLDKMKDLNATVELLNTLLDAIRTKNIELSKSTIDLIINKITYYITSLDEEIKKINRMVPRAEDALLRKMEEQRKDPNYFTKLGLVNTSLDYN